MQFELEAHRNASELLAGRPAWEEFKHQLGALSGTEIIDEYDKEIERFRQGKRKEPPKGAQPALNLAIKRRLEACRWASEPRLFMTGGDSTLRRWKMDFLKDRLGVEIVFNHAEAIAWAFTRLHMAGESTEVIPECRIEVGIAVFASDGLKEWGRMDGAVGTFEMAREWLRVMRPILPMPIQLVGLLKTGLPEERPFLGTGGSLAKAGEYDAPPGE
jgi:hypothetical protein